MSIELSQDELDEVADTLRDEISGVNYQRFNYAPHDPDLPHVIRAFPVNHDRLPNGGEVIAASDATTATILCDWLTRREHIERVLRITNEVLSRR